MDETDTTPATDSGDSPGAGKTGTGSPPPADRPLTGMQMRPRPPDPVTGEIFLDVGPDLAGYLDDLGWFEEESWAGRWFPFAGKYVAVLNKAHVDTDDDFTALRERVAREHGVDPERILIQYLPPPLIVEG
jgi:diadenosine tetraphosphatase ApaH/serine/threonine PP2A family protein phosphatase